MTRPSAGGLLRLVVAVGLTALVLWQSEPGVIAAHVANARPAPLLAAIGLVVFDRALMAWRWQLLLRPFPAAANLTLAPILRIFFVSTFVGTFLPASIGGDAVRAAALSRWRVPLADAVASVFMDRVLGVLSILGMGALGLWLARDLPARAIVIAALVATAAGCAAVAAAVFSTRVAARLVAWLTWLPWARLHRAGASVIEAVQRYATHHRLLALVVAASIAVQILRIVQAYCLGLALGLTAPLSAYFAFVPVILLVMLLPITVNGLGTSQAAFVLFFASADVPAAGAFALSVLFVALGIVGNLPGGLLYAAGGLGLPRAEAPNAKGGVDALR